MAPALTEPLSPTENLTNTAVNTVTPTPTTRSSRKLETVTNNNGLKTTQTAREKRNRSGSLTINQTPTSSQRITRSRDNQFRNSPALKEEITKNLPKISSTKNPSKTISVVPQIDDITVKNSIKSNFALTNNEQMGLSTAPLDNKNKHINTNLEQIVENTKDTSTAQLLADLTNEAITAEICLRNQLKDVNLVKTSGDSSSPIIQQETFVDTDIVVLKEESPALVAAFDINKQNTAHMEAQFIESSKPSTVQSKTTNEEDNISKSPALGGDSPSLNNEVIIEEVHLEEDTDDKVQYDVEDQSEHKENQHAECNTKETENQLHEESPIGSPKCLEDENDTKKESSTSSKLEILSVQELPPVSTDSTMTASEVEDNLEERLSQLDGTAIDSPPPNHDVDPNEKSIQNATATPSHTPTHQTLTQDIQELQQQLQHSPPTPVGQQVQQQSNHQFQQNQQNQQHQTNCFTTSQSTPSSSSISTLGTASNMTQSYIKDSDGGGAAELEDQDIEEVFKVLKGFEGGTTSDLNVCDLNVLFNEVYMKINETELGGSAGNAVGIAASSSSTNTPNHINVTNPSIQLVKPTETEEGQMEIEKRQLQMQRKIDFLMRRLRKLQARYMCKHTSEEIAGLFEWSARQTSKGHTDATTLHNSGNVSAETTVVQDSSKSFLKVIAARPPATEWKDVHESLVPANQLSTLLRKIESVANAQQLCTTTSNSLVNITHKKTKKAQAAASSSAPNSSLYSDGKAEEIVVGTLEENVTDELSQVAGLLQSEICEVQKAVDSDATESSSGGESADEMVTYNNTQQLTLPITKRAAWRYSRDRAAIASRWSWLLSQISDLEIKIRQHSELHQEIMRSKGLVTCGVNQSENEYRLNTSNSLGEQENENEAGSCRTRGYVPALFRKRKLIQTTNIHTISKKAARASTIKCGCQWPMHPCALCTGRLDPTAPRDLPDTMMMSDRIALLDSGYHPVLSFRENVNNALHFEAIAKQPEWQQRVMRCPAKNIAKNLWRAEREAVAAAAGGHHSSSSKKFGDGPPTKRRYIKKKDRLHTDDKNAGGKSTHSTTGNQHQVNNSATTTAVANQFISTSSISAASSNDVGNGTATLSTTTSTTSTTPLVANKVMAKNAKKQYCLVAGDGIIKEPVNSLQQNNMSLTSLSTTTTVSTNNNVFIHQTSDCHQTKFDPFNPNQTPSSLISNINTNNSHSKSNKHRKLSSSTTASSHLYNHHFNNSTSSTIYNGDSNYMLGHENWGGAGSGENLNIRSRTSSPTHGNSGNVYPKYERSLDRKNRSSYDIDNIVIPYSVAAATRVEILPYKEIPTPKWRVVDNDDERKNKLKISSNSEPHNEIDETSTESEPMTNGHICDNNGNVDSIESDKAENEDKTKNECNEKFESKEIEPINSKANVEEKASKASNILNNKHMVSSSIAKNEIEHNDDNIKQDVKEINEKNSEEPKSMKLNNECDVIKKIKESNELQNELKDDDELALQTSSKGSIEDDEDISDDAMFLRHERALTEERRKFQTYLKFPWSTRSRANRRIDSRAESSGANTPDPSSPAPQTPSVCGGDQESIPSPLNPATPLNPLDIISEAGDNSTSFLGVGPLPSLSSKRYERRRTTSTKKDRETERRSSTPDAKELIPPYEPLTFPLTDDQFEELLRSMPSDHSEDSKRFDECYLPVSVNNVGGVGMGGGILNTKYPRTTSGSNSKRTSRSSTLCAESIGGGNRRIKSSNKNLRPISADDSNLATSHVNGDILLYDDEYDDDYPKHHLAPNDDHLTADNIVDGNEDDIYGDQYDAYVGRQQQHKHHDSEVLTSEEEEPFQDDDPNDPEWRGETEDRLRKKV